MVYVDKTSLGRLIRKHQDYLSQLKKLQTYKQSEFTKDWLVYSTTERCLHLALESFLDVGKKVINQLDLERPDRYRDIPIILVKNKIISEELQAELVKLADFRNILVHDYLYLDLDLVYQHLQEDPAILEKFVSAVKKKIKELSRTK